MAEIRRDTLRRHCGNHQSYVYGVCADARVIEDSHQMVERSIPNFGESWDC